MQKINHRMLGKWMKAMSISLLFYFVLISVTYAWNNELDSSGSVGFDVVALGVKGGIDSSNLSSFYIQPINDNRGVIFDAGSIVPGIEKAIQKKSFHVPLVHQNQQTLTAEFVLTEWVKGYVISHAHLDHVAGLVVVSPDDTTKPIYALKSTLNIFERHLFNWQVWPNFANRGVPPTLAKYTYTELKQNARLALTDTKLNVTAYPLSHNGVESTAFLIEYSDSAILCIGDTGADKHEGGRHLRVMWNNVARYVNRGALKGIIIETSYSNERPGTLLFGHLTPQLVIEELNVLVNLISSDNAIQGLPVIISHLKYNLSDDTAFVAKIKQQFKQANTLGVKFVFPTQGQRIRLP